MSFILLLSGLFLGWSLGANDAGNVFGAAVETRMIKFKTAALIASIFVILGAVLQGGGTSLTLSRLGSVNALPGSFTVALSAALSLIVMVRFKIPVSSSQAVVGAILGWNIFSGAFTDSTVLAQIVSAWIITPILSAILTILMFYLFNYIINHFSIHLLKLDYFTRAGLLLVGAFGSFSLGANNIANVMGMFVDSSPFKDVFITNHIFFSSTHQLFLIGALSIAFGIFTYSHKNMKTIGHDLFKLSPITGFIVVLSSSIVLFLFASKSLQELLHSLHLPTLPLVPVSSSQAVIGSIIGLSIAKKTGNIQYKILGKIASGWVINPIFSGLICFVLLFFVQNVFDQKVYIPSVHTFNRDVMVKLNIEDVLINKLSFLNGRTYQSSSELKNQLVKYQIEKNNQKKIAEYSLLFPLFIDENKIKTLDHKFFTSEQLHALRLIKNQPFDHKWQLIDTLSVISNSWSFRDEVWQNEYYNREIQKKYEIIFKLFSTPINYDKLSL